MRTKNREKNITTKTNFGRLQNIIKAKITCAL